MSWVRVWIHMVFCTKNRYPFLNTFEQRSLVFDHIKENAKMKGIFLQSIGGFKDHVHCLISLNKSMTISTTAQLIKGESSFWINRNKITPHHFHWQDDYWAVGVSEKHASGVVKYIENQEIHHKHKTFAEEIDRFMEKYGWEIIKGN